MNTMPAFQPPPVTFETQSGRWVKWYVLVVLLLSFGFAIGLFFLISGFVSDELDKGLEAGFGRGISSDVTAPGDDLLADGVEPLVSEIGRIIGGDVQALSVAVTPTNVNVEAQVPGQPGLVDEYTWAPTLGFRGPNPVDLSTFNRTTEGNLFPLTSVNWAALPTMVRTAQERTGIAESKPTNVLVESVDGGVVVRVFVQGPRGSGFATFTPAGELIGVG